MFAASLGYAVEPLSQTSFSLLRSSLLSIGAHTSHTGIPQVARGVSQEAYGTRI